MDIAIDFLNKRGIPIVLSETGGCFGSRLLLDTSNWKASIEPVFDCASTTPRGAALAKNLATKR